MGEDAVPVWAEATCPSGSPWACCREAGIRVAGVISLPAAEDSEVEEDSAVSVEAEAAPSAAAVPAAAGNAILEFHYLHTFLAISFNPEGIRTRHDLVHFNDRDFLSQFPLQYYLC